ncbi:MAG: STAS domain-containing protein [Neisseriaceae bacterium]|nr:STAS domain-containing protein [Neisseriaceae bacterium]
MQQKKSGQTLILSGNIDNFAVNVDIFRDFVANLAGVQIISFQNIERVDSTAIALIAAAKRRLKQSLKLENIPPQMADLLKLYHLDDWVSV